VHLTAYLYLVPPVRIRGDILQMDILTIDVLPIDMLPLDLLPMLHNEKLLTVKVIFTFAPFDKHCVNSTVLPSCSHTTATAVGMNLQIAPVRSLPDVIIIENWV